MGTVEGRNDRTCFGQENKSGLLEVGREGGEGAFAGGSSVKI